MEMEEGRRRRKKVEGRSSNVPVGCPRDTGVEYIVFVKIQIEES